jgi:hypothetical protein
VNLAELRGVTVKDLFNLVASKQVEWVLRDGLKNDLTAAVLDSGAYRLDVGVLNAYDHAETDVEFPI